jgi:hypothetical protein
MRITCRGEDEQLLRQVSSERLITITKAIAPMLIRNGLGHSNAPPMTAMDRAVIGLGHMFEKALAYGSTSVEWVGVNLHMRVTQATDREREEARFILKQEEDFR